MIKNSLKKILLTGIIAVTAFSAAGCGKGSGKDKEVNVGYFNNITHAQALLMKAEGTLDKNLGDDVNVKWTAFNAGPAEVEALFSGDIDIGYIGPVPAISANVKSKGDVVIISSATKGGAVLVKRKGADINSVADLDGKTVAIPQIGNTQHLCLLKLLADNNLKPDTSGGTVKVSAVANADVANTMERGDIDAALVPEPWGATLLANDAEMVLDYNEIFENGEYDVAVVVVRKEFMEENPEIVDKFLKQHEEATKKVNDDRENSLKTINNELKEATGKALGEDIISKAFERIGVSTEVNEASVTGFADISKSEGFISELPEGELICR
ncbi:MAG: aliphatic sulfonate ABC transporter substrate-binding protein [Lachnospiraceae bacterium]|nr:aliphatic sulfonate ABC transporter substrate-binding protein [Lachnospiraceae bacterium]